MPQASRHQLEVYRRNPHQQLQCIRSDGRRHSSSEHSPVDLAHCQAGKNPALSHKGSLSADTQVEGLCWSLEGVEKSNLKRAIPVARLQSCSLDHRFFAARRLHLRSPHLRPCSTQLMHQHHRYIDVLPFPTFRERIIKLAYCEKEPMINEDELCQDLIDGLIC